MTTIPAVEKTENAKCSICTCTCMQFCTQCGKNFCTKHLIVHSKKCSGYKAIIRSLLQDDFASITKEIVEVLMRAI